MCIVAVAWQLFEEMPLVLLSNRDEFLQRPTLSAHQWQDLPIFAGRDEESGGTWLGHQQKAEQGMVSQNGRWATVLNFRDGIAARDDQRTRGELVTQFLTSELSPMSFARQIDLQAYAGFNLIVGDARQAVVINNRGYPPTALHNGLHILSNGQPESAWFKCEHLRGRVRQEVLPLIAESFELNKDENYWQPAAWDVLSDKRQAPDDQLPDTGMPMSLEKALSSVFIDTLELAHYGTRTQSILTMKRDTNSEPKITLISREIRTANKDDKDTL